MVAAGIVEAGAGGDLAERQLAIGMGEDVEQIERALQRLNGPPFGRGASCDSALSMSFTSDGNVGPVSIWTYPQLFYPARE